MSRSNPTETAAANPATRWFEWNGAAGTVRYYDREKKENIDIGADFDFILLDELGTVRGWHDESKSGIYSNEVRDTRTETLVVKSFKGGTIATGFYQAIKKDVNAEGGEYHANCYIAFKDDAGKLALGSIRFKGAALGAWMEFRKAHRTDLFTQAVRIHGFTEDKKGQVRFRIPVFELKKLSEASNAAALLLDAVLQAYLTAYLARTTHEQVHSTATQSTAPEPPAFDAPPLEEPVDPVYDDDIPF